MSEITLAPVPLSDKPRLRGHMVAYLAEIAPGLPDPPGPFFDLYWQDQEREVFWIMESDAQVGFAMVNAFEGEYELAEFCVFPPFRRRGIGRRAARAVLGRYPGTWEIGVATLSPGGAGFWREVIEGCDGVGDMTEGPPMSPVQAMSFRFGVAGASKEVRAGVPGDRRMTMLNDLWFDPGKVFIDGAWRMPALGGTLDIENPSDGSKIGEIARGTAEDIDAAVNAAQAALDGDWGRMTALERGRILKRIGELVTARIDQLAVIEATDVGKPLTQARNDAIALARYMEFYAGAADKVMGETIPYLAGYTVYTLREPHGVTGHIIPWNYPMQIIGRSVGGALAMGNACVLKPAEEACLTALAFAEIAREAGLPPGALNVVPGLGEEAGAALTSHPGVNHLSFTGSVGVGRLVQKAAAENLVPVTLELGGKSPQVVFADADLDAAMPFLVGACIQNAGQTCSAASRVLIQRPIYDQLVARMADSWNGMMSAPAMMDANLGPLISARQKEIVEGFLAMGADLRIAGQGTIVDEAPAGGHYTRATLFADVPPDHPLAQQEIFGPVQVAIPFEDEDEAVAIANGTGFGLVASVWTENGARQMRMAKRLRAGQVFINNYGAGGGVELPFGGTGLSGHGREKGFEALYGFSTLKTVAAKHD